MFLIMNLDDTFITFKCCILMKYALMITLEYNVYLNNKQSFCQGLLKNMYVQMQNIEPLFDSPV